MVRIVSGSFDKTVQVWYVQTGDLMRTFPDSNAVYAVAWSPDGTRVAAGDGSGYINIWKV
jgi:WD40 repeat protein